MTSLVRQVRPGDVEAAHRNKIIAMGSAISLRSSEIMAGFPEEVRSHFAILWLMHL
jgi:hypothetical protein